MSGYNEKFIAKNPNFVKVSEFFDGMFHSVYFLIFAALLSIVGFLFDAEIVTIFIMLAVISLNLALTRDISPSFLLTVLIALVPMKYANTQLDGFMVFMYAPVFFVPAIVLRFVFFPAKFIKGKNFIPLLVYSVVLCLGGIGSGITAGQYFAFYPLYTMLGLGFLQVLMYLFWQNYLPENGEKNILYFCKMMCVVGLVSIVFIAITYAEYYAANPGTFKFVFFAWKNYISDILMLSMPFAFYLAVKTRYKIGFIVFGLLQYLAVIFTKSGGGIICATLILPFLIILTLIKTERKKRIKILIALAAIAVPIIFFVIYKRDVFYALYLRKIETGGSERLTLYKIAIEVFKKYPIFGAGLGYVNDFMIQQGFIMTYFHSTFFQALGATGLVGVLGYAYMAVSRLLTYCKKYTFNLFLLIGFLGYAGYSLFDVGTAMPFPFVMMCTFMLVLTEKYSAYRKTKAADDARGKVTAAE
jgi:hypothetical protein